jgi:phenazine biosynthesis protein phzE
VTAPAELLDRVLGPQPPPFALLHRPEATGEDWLEVLVGEMSTPATLAQLPLSADADRPRRDGSKHTVIEHPRHDVLAVVPFRQLAERGFTCVDDGAPLLAMRVTGQAVLPLAEVLARIPAGRIRLDGAHFDLEDGAYADAVRRIVAEEIGTGEGANFVLRRTFLADIAGYTPASALTFFRRLCERETGAYWTFVVHTGERTFVGASPERQVSQRAGVAVMNPISGTYRYAPDGPTLDGMLRFLSDAKESDELHMVVDEELKMMARICEGDVRVIGPRLKEMARLAHTEYLIEGRCDRDPREVLRATMFAPTVTGSPLESACRVISRHEPAGRGYYAGALALIGRDGRGRRELDSAILIRTADIDAGGRLAIGVGATVVRHSDPHAEAAETRAKAAGLLAAIGADRPARLGDHPAVRAALARRNAGLAGFWLDGGHAAARPAAGHAERLAEGHATRPAAGPAVHPAGGHAAGRATRRRVLVVDAEDTFTAMIAHQLRSLDLDVTVRRFDEDYCWTGEDLVVMGPGPGDPSDTAHPRIAHLYSAIGALLAQRRPFLAVCLSHQVLCRQLGLELARCPASNQGRRRRIDLFGDSRLVGFYNSFAARCDEDKIDVSGVGLVEVSRDPATGEVFALRGPHFASLQFHAESVLTEHGPRIFADRIIEVLAA